MHSKKEYYFDLTLYFKGFVTTGSNKLNVKYVTSYMCMYVALFVFNDLLYFLNA